MEEVFKKIIVVLVVLIFIILGIKYIPFGTKDVRLGATLINIEVPKLSSLDSECCEYEATFKTLRGKKVVQKELDNIMSKYSNISCNGNNYYYDYANDITYTKYEVYSGLIFNSFKISYVRNNICEM